MASLEISFLSGKTQLIELSKQQPLSIGSHASNDLQIEDEGVASMQCRISWNKKGYEVVAATSEGIEINGTMSGRCLLNDGDLIRIGEADILFTDEVDLLDIDAPLPDVSGKQEESMYDLKPVSHDALESVLRSPTKSPADADQSSSKSSKESNSKQESKPAKKKSSKPKKEKKSPKPEKPPEEELPADDDLDLVSASELLVEDLESDESGQAPKKAFISRSSEHSSDEVESTNETEEAKEKSTLSLKDRVRRRSSKNAVRPGERQIVRSPLVLSLTGGSVLLALTALIFWFIIGRDTAKRHYDAAIQEMESGKYSQAIQLFEEFLETYSKSDYADEARNKLSQSLVEKEISGSTPSWKAGLEATNQFVKKHRDDPEFQEMYPILADYGQRIALGAVDTASRTKERELLTTSKNAEKILIRYSPQDAPPEDALAEIKSVYEKAEAEILRKEVFDVAVLDIEKSIKQKDTLKALELRRHLLDRYPYYKNDRKMSTVLTDILEIEKGLVQVNNEPVAASKQEYPDSFPQKVTLTLHTRSRSNTVSDGRNVFALGNGSCFGIDSVTGGPVWRRPIGLNAPFAPLTISISEPALILYDTRHQELLCVTQKNGSLIWRQKMPARPSGKPLIHKGLIVISCNSGDLLSVDATSGNILSQLKFAQPLVGAPGLVYGEQAIAVAGYEAVIYLVSLRPFTCQRVSTLGHRPGTIKIPIIPMGKLLLVCENDRAESALLHVLEGDGINASLNELEQYRIKGQVQSMPVLRGKQLFFPTIPERITAFTVTDEKGKRKLSELASFQLQDPLSCQVYLSAGSGDQLWMSSSALRKLTLLNSGIKLDKKKIAEGLGAQPMQLIGTNLYIARRLLSSKSVIFTIANRDEMTSSWKSILGTDILGTYSFGKNGLVCVSSDGDIFRLRDKDFSPDSSTFKQKPITQLKLPEGLTEPLKSKQLSDGRIAVYCGSPQPTLWVLNTFGQLEQTIDLKAPLDTMPALIGDGIALPFQNKIAVFRKGRGFKTVQEFALPDNAKAKIKWNQLISTAKDQCIAVTSSGQIITLQYRKTPVRHLAAVSMIDDKQPIDFKAGVSAEYLAFCDASGQLQLLDAKTAQLKAKTQLGSPAINDLWISKNLLFVETKQNLSCFSIDKGLQKLWDLKLPESSVAGQPTILANQILITLQDGNLLAVDSKTGTVQSKTNLPLPTSGAIVNLEKIMVVPTLDGSLYRIDQVLQQKGQASL